MDNKDDVINLNMFNMITEKTIELVHLFSFTISDIRKTLQSSVNHLWSLRGVSLWLHLAPVIQGS